MFTMLRRLAAVRNLLGRRKVKSKPEVRAGALFVGFQLGSYGCRYIAPSSADLQSAISEIEAGAAAGIWKWHSERRQLGVWFPWRFEVATRISIDVRQLKVQLVVTGSLEGFVAPEDAREVFQSLASEVLGTIGRAVMASDLTCQLTYGDGMTQCPTIYPTGVTRSMALA